MYDDLRKSSRNEGKKGDPVYEKEVSAKEVRGYYKQFAEAKHLEYMG